MILITSAAYVGPEFQAEFGKLPPAFLPVGNKRLFKFQVAALNAAFSNEEIWLSTPESYQLSGQDNHTLKELNVKTINVPDNLTLADSILFCLNVIETSDKQIRILHGDTYLPQVPNGNNVLALASTQDYYNWEVESSDLNSESVWCGYFSFSNIRELIKNLTICRGDFVKAVRMYDHVIELEKSQLDQWFDLGHINTFYKTRAKITTQRSFNELTITDTHVYKSGTPGYKISAEGNWFANLPISLKGFVPQLMGQGVHEERPYYVLEFLYLAPLNELLVNGNNPVFFWRKIFKHLSAWLQACTENFDSQYHSKIETARKSLFADKTISRLTDFCRSMGFDTTSTVTVNGCKSPSIGQVMDECINLALSKKSVPGVLHGDLCFSNILYDSRADAIKLIDPRAIDVENNFTMYGDIAYDVAKLNHSLIGLYDHIIAGAYHLQHDEKLNFNLEIFTDQRITNIQKAYLQEPLVAGSSALEYMPLTILLFLSMLPLHSDNKPRQLALFANAFRLYNEFINSDIKP
ncbi:hypothetical protein SJI00_01465 [Pseudomonas sp. RP23018S]|uniref:hypothetical protein n=1 Tax=Pseudomonas sp. RP23018S TaxID=3096037 RepID=UPI002ACB01B2|nr:hypothetical protein [Pseudomonas sp. RP23018S]MDZ5601453.1 hypothetical protein [Pseudomonas sp. RP23018S]